MIAVYTYRACGLRHTKTVNGFTTTHVWNFGSIVLERNASGAVVNRFHRGLGHLISSDHHGYYLFNVRGDVIQRVDSAGNIIHTYRYDAFGNEQNQDAVNTNPFRFAGEYYDFETGFIYLRARFYNPVLGRFISEDPHWNIRNMQFGDNPVTRNGRPMPNPLIIMQAGNLYMYCIHNPVMWIDPSGLILQEHLQRGRDFANEILRQFPHLNNPEAKRAFSTQYGNRIFDFANSRFFGEIKNTSYQSLTQQLRGFLQIAGDQRRPFVLIVNEATRLSEPLKREIIAAGGAIYTFGSQGLTLIGGTAMRMGSSVSLPLFFIPMSALEEMLQRPWQLDPIII